MDAALWLRVSTGEQHTENQELDLRRLAHQRGIRVMSLYRLTDVSAFRGKQRPVLDAALEAAHRGEFQCLLVWALDRLSRESAVAPWQILQRFKDAGVDVISYTEPWVSTTGPSGELLTLIAGWFAHYESVRRGERIRAGLARRAAEGLPVGRKKGARDLRPRRRSGYVARYEDRPNKLSLDRRVAADVSAEIAPRRANKR